MSLESDVDRVVPVMVPMPAERPYSYGVPVGMHVEPGSIVRVPLGPREVAGVVWHGECERIAPSRLRKISHAFDCPPLPAEMRRFVDWVASYTLAPPGMVVRMALRAPAAFDPEPAIEGLCFTGLHPDKVTPARRRLLDYADNEHAWTRSGLANAAGVSASVIDGLTTVGVFEYVAIPPQPIVAMPDPGYGRADLTPEQSEAANRLQ